MFATAVAAAGSRSSAATRRASTSTPFARAFSRVASIDGALDVDAERPGRSRAARRRSRARPEPQPTSSKRAALELLQELEAEPRRRVRARAEGAAGVDDDRERVGRRRLPRRADPERADPDRPVERAPAVLPARLDVVAAGAAEEVPEALLPARVRVGGELDALRAVDLLEALGEELEHRRAGLLEPLEADLDGHSAQAAQRNALFSFSKKPSSWR